VEKSEAAVKELEARDLAGTVALLQMDVNSEGSIKGAAETVEGKYGR